MEDDKVTAATTLRRRPAIAELLEQYGCGPVRFTGTDDALYERHLMFDNVVAAAAIGRRERFEAVARSVRDVLSPYVMPDELPMSAPSLSISCIVVPLTRVSIQSC